MALTLEQQMYDLIADLGGRARVGELGPVLGRKRTDISTAGRRLARRGCIERSGNTWQLTYRIIGPRPPDLRGVNPGSRAAWYGVNGKTVEKGNNYRRRGKSKPKAPEGVTLWSCWLPSPQLGRELEKGLEFAGEVASAENVSPG